MELSEIFWVSFLATASALIFGLVKACIKSKCDTVEAGCIKIHRNIKAEQEVHKFDMEHNRSPINNFDV